MKFFALSILTSSALAGAGREPAMVELQNPNPNESSIFRAPESVNGLVQRPPSNASTLFEVFEHAAMQFPDQLQFGERSIVNIIEEEKDIKAVVDGKEQITKKKWKYFQLSQYNWMSYSEVRFELM